jgi:hypothetical protein
MMTSRFRTTVLLFHGLCAVVAMAVVGCQLVVDFDRSAIVDAAADAAEDGGIGDALVSPDAADDADAVDTAVPFDAEADAEAGDAAADTGAPDVGLDAHADADAAEVGDGG